MDEFAIRLQEVVDRSIRNENRIEKLEADQKALNELALSVQELAVNQTNMKSDIGEIKKDIKSLTAIPSQRWNNLIDKAIAVLVGMFLSYILSQV